MYPVDDTIIFRGMRVRKPGGTEVVDNVLQTVDASPTKVFYLYDYKIYIRPAIVELIDNAIGGAKRVCPEGNYEGKKVEIFFDNEKFTIRDNYGGIGIETATKYYKKQLEISFGRQLSRQLLLRFYVSTL